MYPNNIKSDEVCEKEGNIYFDLISECKIGIDKIGRRVGFVSGGGKLADAQDTTNCKIDSHIPTENGDSCECGYFRKENRTTEGIKYERDTVSNFMNFKKDVLQIVIEDVPHQYQDRLLEILDIDKKVTGIKNY